MIYSEFQLYYEELSWKNCNGRFKVDEHLRRLKDHHWSQFHCEKFNLHIALNANLIARPRLGALYIEKNAVYKFN